MAKILILAILKNLVFMHNEIEDYVKSITFMNNIVFVVSFSLL